VIDVIDNALDGDFNFGCDLEGNQIVKLPSLTSPNKSFNNLEAIKDSTQPEPPTEPVECEEFK
jgi:hypothetical protein